MFFKKNINVRMQTKVKKASPAHLYVWMAHGYG